MTDGPSLALTHSFAFRGRHNTYTIAFFSDNLAISTKNKEPELIPYSKIHRIRSCSDRLRIIFKDDEPIDIPCTITEIRQIRRLFKRSSSFHPSKIRSTAFVEFGDACFFLRIDTNHFNEYKSAIIKRIARFFFPALDQEGISLDLFQKFLLKVRKGDRLVQIENSEDLDAALAYFDYKINILIEYSDD